MTPLSVPEEDDASPDGPVPPPWVPPGGETQRKGVGNAGEDVIPLEGPLGVGVATGGIGRDDGKGDAHISCPHI